MTARSILILGARSEIALEVAHLFAAAGHAVRLAARDCASLEADRADIVLRRGVDATLHEFDACAIAGFEDFVDSLPTLPDVALCAVGTMGQGQAACEADVAATVEVMRSNYEGPAAILAVLANRFAARGSGTLVAISSVAGDRGRASNYVYGSAKAGLTAFLSGLRARLSGTGVHVVTIKPGFVETRMTAGMKLPPLLTAQPSEVAHAIALAVRQRRNVVYVRPIWRLIMLAIRHIPEAIFKRMSF